ncbi:zinc ribbon domain-containing protein [Deinococcus yunweiensis]|uniref:zinc ribbon domain-containing protein n=1 Tax=Deinococcus yunweiensis TaxID=367282 RepID=UPI00398EC656
MPPRPKTLILPTTIHPSPEQIHDLQSMWSAVLTAQHAVTAFLHHRAAGGTATLLAVASSPSQPITASTAHLQLPTLAQLEAEFRVARDALGWSATVPASALRWMLAATLREWRAGGGAPALPRPWPRTRPPHLQLDHAVQLRDDVTLEIAGVGRELAVSADLFLPHTYWRALLRHQHRRNEAHRAHLERLEARWLDQADATAAAELFARRARSARRGTLPDPGREVAGAPIARERVAIRHVDGDGLPPRWIAEWAFGTSELALRKWIHDDVLGLDLGYRHPFAAVSSHHTILVPRPFHGEFRPPALTDRRPWVGRLELARARALHRRSLFLRLLPIYEAQLELALNHRVVALEAMAWAGFARRHLAFADYAQAVGLTNWVEWLGELAPQHGVQVLTVPPEYTSRTCSRCGHIGKRPRSGRPFHCAQCGHVKAADVNAAAVIRARGQRLLGTR